MFSFVSISDMRVSALIFLLSIEYHFQSIAINYPFFKMQDVDISLSEYMAFFDIMWKHAFYFLDFKFYSIPALSFYSLRYTFVLLLCLVPWENITAAKLSCILQSLTLNKEKKENQNRNKSDVLSG